MTVTEMQREIRDDVSGFDIAIIGVNGRFPGAGNVKEFWRNLQNGVSSIATFTDAEVAAAGVPDELLQNPHYVKAGGILNNVDLFDAAFFGFYPREAALMDPQHRLFLECAYEALEIAGYDPDRARGLIGVYASMSMNTYLLFNLTDELNVKGSADIYPIAIGNDKDFLTTRVSYKLNLKGPSVNVQSACSSSLVATHLACQALINYQCDIALAGGVSITLPQKRGYLYQEGGIASPDGQCRPFDVNANGTIGGSGVGIVVLKRLEDALADGDQIYAVIKGSAINNDGSLKVGYTAPSVDGQVEVIAAAQALAGVDPETITYIETHGTGTSLGDPIEVMALNEVFRSAAANGADPGQFCALSAVKSNVGHLDAAAGVTGLIKAALALQHKQIPPVANFQAPNPRIDFANSPFFVADRLLDWEPDGLPRRAGVSSFGIGGTNAHVVLEEAPQMEPPDPSRPLQLLLLSAKTQSALDQATWNLADHLLQNPDANLADVAYTLQVGRRGFSYRRALVARDAQEAVTLLGDPEAQRGATAHQEHEQRPVVFMFTGQGAQYPDMGRELYETEPIFREQVDLCCDLLESHLGLDLRDLLYPPADQIEEAAAQLQQTALTQPALFTVEYALAQLWMAWGVLPAAMIGHSIGEYVAACLAGVFTLEDALELVAARGRLMQALPGGAMLSVPLTEEVLRPYLTPDLALAAVNAPALCAVSGDFDAIAALEARLAADDVAYRRLHTSHAFHSPMMDPIVAPFTRRVADMPLAEPQIPFVSNVSGTWITADEATDPAYWAAHLRQGVRFADGVAALMEEDPNQVLLEVGPGATLASLARRHPAVGREQIVLASLRHPKDLQSDVGFILMTLGKLWLAGVEVDWDGFYADERRRRVPLPAYPFERKRYWIEPKGQARPETRKLQKRKNVADWFYLPSWQRVDLPTNGAAPERQRWLLFVDEGLGPETAVRLSQLDQEIITVQPGDRFQQHADGRFSLRPGHKADYSALIAALAEGDRLPERVVHFWSAMPAESLAAAQDHGFYSLLALVQALDEHSHAAKLRIDVVTASLHEVIGTESVQPFGAAVLGACRVIPQELPHITCRTIDVPAPLTNLAPRLVAELLGPAAQNSVAYRGRHRWAQTFMPLPLDDNPGPPALLREKGVYLITGGLGRIGLVFADYLARTAQARLALLDRARLPERSAWDAWLANHGPDEGASKRILAVRALEAQGAQVLTAVADVTDRAAMQTVLDDIYAKFGTLNGVIHAAGLVGAGAITPIQGLERAACDAQFAPKMEGLLVIEELLAGRDLDFCLLQSSISSQLGGLGFIAYAGANAFMDACAQRVSNTESATPWISVNWDGWAFAEEANARTGIADLNITPQEGVAALARILSLEPQPQIIVSTADLQARLERYVAPSAIEEPDVVATAELHERPALQTDYTAPRTDLEASIIAMWQKVLGLDRIGVHDDFFELGGHSLLATQLISRLRDLYSVDLPLSKLFEQPTVAGLAALIEAGRAADSAAAGPAITPVTRDGALPLSSGQQRLWFLDQLEPGSPLYNNFAAVHLSGALDVDVLTHCINEIAHRHEALRTTFGEEDGNPIQVIHPELTLEIPVVDLQSLEANAQTAEIERLARAEGSQSFDLTQGPLLRIKLLKLSADEHVAFMTMHHIVSDGWSVMVLIQEVVALYAAFAAGAESPLAGLTIQYADYAAWQRQWLQSEALAQQMDYWRAQLADAPALELPTDYPRPAVQTSHGANVWFELPRDLVQALLALGQAENATLFMILTAALQTLLYRYSGQEDVSLGTPIANRTRSETEQLIGFLLNTLVLRTDLSGAPSFRELLARVRATALAAYDHQDTPFELLVETLQPTRDMSRAPFFQVMFDLQKAQLGRLELAGLAFEQLQVDIGTAKFDLALSMEEDAERLYGYLNYNTDLFAHETITAMLAHFETLLRAIVADPAQSIAALPLLTASETAQLLAWSHESSPAPRPYQSIVAQIAQQAAARPEATAVQLDHQQLTYAALERQANQLARALLRRGLQPGDVVGLYLERSLDAIVGMLAILKTGGVYLPLETGLPAERLAYMLADAQVKILLTIDDLRLTIDDLRLASGDLRLASGPVVICVDGEREAIAQEAAATPAVSLAEADPAYVIYTSGSTGAPKGVLIGHGALGQHIPDVAAHFDITPQDRVLQFAALSFDQSVEQILATLASGATLVMRGPDIWPPADFSQVIADAGLTIINLPPIYWNQWLQAGAERMRVIPAGQLKLVIIGGDVMLGESLRLWREAIAQETPLRAARLLNAYGPTETTITAMTYAVPNDFAEDRIPIGRPLPQRAIFILDQHGNLLPPAVPGELHIGGAGLALGYLNRPDLTAEKFVSIDDLRFSIDDLNRQSSINNRKLYRTGDLARFLPDGNVKFLGRVDNQVKVRGFRIELGEIEAVLSQYVGVRETAVVVREDTPDDKRIIAYVVSAEPAPTTEALRTYLQAKLPDYMTPAAFVIQDAFPLTPSGKIDRRALPAPDLTAALAETYVAPRTPLEEDLVAMWANVLKVERVGIHDNFFDLGGHSLIATQLIARVRAEFQVDLPLRRLFETPTIAGLAELITASLLEETDADELAQLMAELDGLSPEEVAQLLNSEA